MATLSPEVRNLVRRAFFLRATVAIVLTLFTEPGWLAPDELFYKYRSAALAMYWRGEILYDPAIGWAGQPLAFDYILSVLYVPFGDILLLARLLNGLIGSLAVLEVCRVTRLLGGGEAASLRAGQLLAYFPSQVLWASIAIRDIWVQWILLLLARQVIELRGRLLLTKLGSVLLLTWALTHFRSYLLFAALGPLVLSFVLGPGKDAFRNLLMGLVVVLGLVWVDTGRSGPEDKVRNFDLQELQRLRSWSSSEIAADSGFAKDADISTIGGALSLLPTGLVYFFFAPFPWQLGSFRQALAVPETLWFYTLVPSTLAGFIHLLRNRFHEANGVILLTLSLTFGYAIGQGNVGTLYRHKAQVIPFYYAFAAIGMEARRRARAAVFAPVEPPPTLRSSAADSR